MVIFNYLSKIIDTSTAIAAPCYVLSSPRKSIPLEILVWRLADKPLAPMDVLPRHHKSCDDVDNFPGFNIRSGVVMSPSAVPSKMHWQNADQSNQAGNTAKTQPSSTLGKDFKFSLRQRLHARIDHWLDENIANLVEDALQATPQSRTKPIDKPE